MRQKREHSEGLEEIFGSEGYVYYLDCSDGFTDVYICQNSTTFNFYINFNTHFIKFECTFKMLSILCHLFY